MRKPSSAAVRRDVGWGARRRRRDVETSQSPQNFSRFHFSGRASEAPNQHARCSRTSATFTLPLDLHHY
jgi:hypothetical protein